MRTLAIAALFTAAAAGCASAKMRVDPGLAASADVFDVTGANPRTWSAPVAFGPWRTGRVAGETTLGWSVAALGVEVAGSRRPYAWRLEGPGAALDAECFERRLEASSLGVTIDVRSAAGNALLACAFRTAQGGAWTLSVRMDPGTSGGFVGELRDPGGASAFFVRSTQALEGSALPLGTPSGWMLERQGGVAAAVETIGSGRVFLPRGAPETPALAAASVALLLFDPDRP